MADPILSPPTEQVGDPYALTSYDGDEADFGPSITMDVTAPPAEDAKPEFDPERPFAHLDFDPEHKQDFLGLLKLGYLDTVTDVAGHRFRIVTPSTRERLEMGIVHKQYLNSMATEPAWRLMLVAAYVREIDGNPAPEPLNRTTGPVATRMEWVLDSIYSELVMRMLFSRVLKLEEHILLLLSEMDDQGKG